MSIRDKTAKVIQKITDDDYKIENEEKEKRYLGETLSEGDRMILEAIKEIDKRLTDLENP